jgi:hypothetical protein
VGGNGGFGGGGGAAAGGAFTGGPGHGGWGGGKAETTGGGGGAGLGGAIFNDGGTVRIVNSTFAGNFVVRGVAGGSGAQLGRDAGGAIFSRNGSLTVLNSTISNNQSTGSDAGIFLLEDGADTIFTLRNTIIANNGAYECHFEGKAKPTGSGNLIVSDSGCPGRVSSADPQVGPLQLNAPGLTPTMAITEGSPAFDAGDDNNCQPVDQRGVPRPQGAHCDIGAFEVQPPIAKCTDVTVSADASGTANASIDDGSFDSDGDPITLSQNPPGPYPVGLTRVTLTVTDNHGVSNSCSATVTVLELIPHK